MTGDIGRPAARSGHSATLVIGGPVSGKTVLALPERCRHVAFDALDILVGRLADPLIASGE